MSDVRSNGEPIDSAASRIVYILGMNEIDRSAYERELYTLCDQVKWFESYDELIKDWVSGAPQLVMVDLDVLANPDEKRLNQLREHFVHSDVVALSSDDSSQLALKCIRSGFTDFILKPVSGEELAWVVRKSQRRYELFQSLSENDEEFSLAHALAQLSNCTTPALAHLSTLENLQRLFQCKGASWFNLDYGTSDLLSVVSSVPRAISFDQIVEKIKQEYFPAYAEGKESSPELEGKTLILSTEGESGGKIFLWGIEKLATPEVVSTAKTILKYSELALLNLKKFSKLKKDTFVDDLTGLYNSRYFRSAVSTTLTRSQHTNQPFSVLFIDVDHFKSINDTHGHLVGSDFLVAIAESLKEVVRDVDLIFRYGGDEFVVILNNASVETAKSVAERIRVFLEKKPFLIREKTVQATVSIGIATYPDHALDNDTLIKLADDAMYSAKKASRNSVHITKASSKAA